PDSLMRGYVGKGGIQVLDPVCSADQIRVQGDTHGAPVPGTLVIKNIERIADTPLEIHNADGGHVEQGHVVELQRIGNGVQPVVHRVRQIVVAPVGDIV